MFLFTTLSVPYSYTRIFPTPTVVNVDEGYAHRPDRIVRDNVNLDSYKEMFNNQINNVSPITTIAGQTYNVQSESTVNLFGIR